MEFYITLRSRFTSKYLSNVPWKFTVKPSIHLPRKGWKVGIAYAVLPPMALFKSLQTANVNLMEVWSKTKKQGQPDEYQKGFFKSSDLEKWENAGLCFNGVDFFNNVKHRLEETAHSELNPGYQFTDWQALEWSKEGTEPELTLKRSVKSNLIYIYKPFAEALKWLNKGTNDVEQVGPNLVHSYPDHLKGASSLDTNTPIKQFPSWLWLSTLSDWRFINLNKSFEQANHLTPRPLQVIAKLKQDGVTVEQPLGHIHYSPKGRESVWFTPTQETFYETPIALWDEVEIHIQELNRVPVSFQFSSECFLILHFKQDIM